ncbi:MAG TPA: hypothetical protein VHC72_13075, partial [Bryobacteraceae bacterium]|nr:hypothetical protein [Bryobacteraceae bacterium]
MATEASGNNSGTMDPVEVEYFDWDPGDSPVSIHMHLGAMDGIARDVIEGFGALPRPDLEIGGLLLGRVENRERPEVWIERYQRITCSHRFGPHFILDREDRDALENAAATILESGDLVVVGFYRSQTRPGLQLEVSDFEMMRQYFSDP